MIQRFTADNSRLALAKVRESLGSEAVILSNRRVGKQVELLAAADLSAVMQEAPGNLAPRGLEPGKASAAAAPELTMARLESELMRLRGMLEQELHQRSWRESAAQPASRSLLQQRLLHMGFSRMVGGRIIDGLEPSQASEVQWQQVLEALGERLPLPREDWQQCAPRVIACVGATGVGKSATVARLAVRDLQHGEEGQVGIIAMDCFGRRGASPLHGLARRFDLACIQAGSLSELRVALKTLGGCRRIYIDTAGLSQRDPLWSEQVHSLTSAARDIALCCVLSAVAQPAQNREILSLLAPYSAVGTVVTKVDESIVLGGVLDAIIRAGFPLLGFSRGQRTPEDLEPADAAELIGLAEKQRLLHANRHPVRRSPASLATA